MFSDSSITLSFYTMVKRIPQMKSIFNLRYLLNDYTILQLYFKGK